MQNIKVYSILSKLDKYEQNRLRKFLCSPYFNKNKTLIDLFEILIDDINEEKKKEAFEKEGIWTILHPHDSYNDVKQRKHFSDLLKLTEDFLVQEGFEKDPLVKKEYLLKTIREKNLNKIYKNTAKQIETLFERHPVRSSGYYYHQYIYEKESFIYNENYLSKTEKRNLEKVSKNLDISYICEKLRFYCYVLRLQHIASHKYEFELIDELILYLNNSAYREIPAVDIYYQNYLTLVDGKNEAHYFNLKKLLDLHSLDFPKEEAANLYLSILNYCVRKINSGNKKFLNEYFEINLDFLNKELIFVDNHLDQSDFNNIVITALRLEKFDWVENFIIQYTQKVKEKYRSNVYTFNIALLYFHQKKYDKVIDLLREVEYENYFYNLRSKAMLLLTYYNIDEVEPLYSLLESFRAFLTRHKEIPQTRRKNYMNLIRFTKKLLKTIPGDKKAIEKIKKEIDETKELANRDWLEEKLAELA